MISEQGRPSRRRQAMGRRSRGRERADAEWAPPPPSSAAPNGTNDFDLWVYGSSASEYLAEFEFPPSVGTTPGNLTETDFLEAVFALKNEPVEPLPLSLWWIR